MILAVANLGFGFRFFVFLHVLAVIIAFAPAFVWPLLGRSRREAGGAPGAATAATTDAPGFIGRVVSPAVHGGALVCVGIFGALGVVTAKHDVYKMSQTWVSIAFLLWFLMLAVFFVGLLPAERKLAGGEVDGGKRAALEQRLSMLYGAVHLLLLLVVIDMVWQPGL
ncbi:MAG TPA: hypothetical protein VHA73_02340 [Acidimicrobiales bacterium]|jgi:hypothetical protein|nr:hypothetical protein [Acidimicrobiales bacterium]